MKLVSGGQTGVDRAALDVALELGLEAGGWCPRGRRAEDGPIPDRYPLTETPERGYEARTVRNIEDSDATVVFTAGRLGPGSRLTLSSARSRDRLLAHFDLDASSDDEVAAELRQLLARRPLDVLNVAGSRESLAPGVGDRVRTILRAVLRPEAVSHAP